MICEYASSATSGKVYTYGHTLISQGNSWYYLYNAHGDVVKYINANGAVLKSYDYDAFGEEADPSATDTNPFRYAGQYFDDETGTYYLRARYYNPGNGRFSQEDTHWNTGNMLYGDDPIKLGEYLKPNMDAIVQSSNLYTYCMGNPVRYVDVNGKFFISTVLLLTIGGALVGGTIGGIGGYQIAKQRNVPKKDVWKYVGGGILLGGGLGAAGGYFIAPTVTTLTGVAGLTVGTSGIGVVTTATIDAVAQMNQYISSSGQYITSNAGNTYYHVTTVQNAEQIIRTGSILPGEAGRVFVTSVEPTLAQVQYLGSYGADVVIQFTSSTNLFVADATVNGIIQGAMMTSIPNIAIQIMDPVVKVLQ